MSNSSSKDVSFLKTLPKMTKDKVQFVAIGGIGEIGMNAYLYGLNDKYLLVDCGVSFGTPFTPGAEVLLPDLSVLETLGDKLVGLVLTHGHEDHIGAVGYLFDELDCPIYATPFTAALLADKLKENDVDPASVVRIQKPGGRVQAGPFDIEFVKMVHSIPEPSAIALHTPQGVIFHTGDWKTDSSMPNGVGVDQTRLQQLGEEGVYAVIGDSTNVLTERDAGSEATAREGLRRVIKQQTGKVVVACFATNFTRVKSVIEIAQETGRHVALAGRSMRRIIRVAKETGYLTDGFVPVSEEDVSYLPSENVLVLSTGSQGESRAALTRIASDGNRNISLGEGDTVIYSSRVIPGNELEISKVQNKLADKGVKIITDEDERDIHVSGHPGRKELRLVYSWLKPKYIVPVHGEPRHLRAHAALATEEGFGNEVLKNGEVICLGGNVNERQGAIETGKLSIEGDRYVDIYGEMMRERRKVTQTGIINVALALNAKGRLMGQPSVSSVGVLELPEEMDIVEDASDYTARCFSKLNDREKENNKAIAEALRVKLRRYFNNNIGKKPMVNVQVLKV